MWLYWRHRFQILHCHAGYPAAYVAATFKRLSGSPLSARMAVTYFQMIISVSTHGWSGACVAPWQQNAVIAQGRFLKDVILELGVAEKRIHVIHNGVDVAACRRHAIPHPRPYILSVGKFKPHKGFDILLRAYARLHNPPVDPHGWAWSANSPRLMALAQQLGGDRVRFVDCYRWKRSTCSATVLSVPRAEIFANVILEALALDCRWLLPTLAAT